MKRGTPRNPKTRRLARALEVSLPHAIGLLELLWHWTAEQAPDGGIGAKLTDAELADFLEWEGDPAKFTDALVENGWLDRVEGNARIVVHDWSEHAEDSVHTRLARAGTLFADGRRPRSTRINKTEREDIEARLDDAEAEFERRRAHDKRGGQPEGSKGDLRSTSDSARTASARHACVERPASASASASASGDAHGARAHDDDLDLSNPAIALRSLSLYEKDEKLRRRWAELYPAWVDAFPEVDVMPEVRSAHVWELEQPLRKRKRDRAKFLGSWIRRAAERARLDTTDGSEPYPDEPPSGVPDESDWPTREESVAAKAASGFDDMLAESRQRERA